MIRKTLNSSHQVVSQRPFKDISSYNSYIYWHKLQEPIFHVNTMEVEQKITEQMALTERRLLSQHHLESVYKRLDMCSFEDII